MNNKITQLRKEIEEIRNNKSLSETTKHFHYIAIDNELDSLLRETLKSKFVLAATKQDNGYCSLRRTF